jgi:beta-mannosidase
VDLGGIWKAWRADEDSRRSGFDADFDDSAWFDTDVPAAWTDHPIDRGPSGPMLYRRHFETDGVDATKRWWLHLDGVSYTSDVWLDGSYLGDTEGSFVPHVFEITDAMVARRDHVLAAEVACPAAPTSPRQARRATLGAFHDERFVDTHTPPGGIWGAVTVRSTGAVRFPRVRCLCPSANESVAVLDFRSELDSPDTRTVVVRTVVRYESSVIAEQDEEHPLAAGLNRIEWKVRVEDPPLWHPWSRGPQRLVDVTVQVIDAGTVSDQRSIRTGLREIAMDNWVLSVNGQRLFAKGTALTPLTDGPSLGASKEAYRTLRAVRDAGFDLVRIHTHVAPVSWYSAADELGLLIWQDVPMSGRYQRTIKRTASRQIRELIDFIGHHPSIAFWCGRDTSPTRQPFSGSDLVVLDVARRLVAEQLPNWGRSVLDRSLRRVFLRGDSSRPTVAHSDVLPHLPLLMGTSTDITTFAVGFDDQALAGTAKAVPRLARCVTGLSTGGGPDGPRRTVETVRRLKYRPSGMFVLGTVRQSRGSLPSDALFDEQGRTADAYHSFVDACQPLIVVADRLPDEVREGQAHHLDVHIVNDLLERFSGVLVTARLGWSAGEHRWAWNGEVGPDSVTRVGELRFVVPEGPDELVLDLDLVVGDHAASNRYRSKVVPG